VGGGHQLASGLQGPPSQRNRTGHSGEVAERPKAHAWKACIRQRIEGSNPSLSANLVLDRPAASQPSHEEATTQLQRAPSPGELAERLKAPDSKSGVPKGIGGSNPSLSANHNKALDEIGPALEGGPMLVHAFPAGSARAGRRRSKTPPVRPARRVRRTGSARRRAWPGFAGAVPIQRSRSLVKRGLACVATAQPPMTRYSTPELSNSANRSVKSGSTCRPSRGQRAAKRAAGSRLRGTRPLALSA
jgi:hypothetical protein